MKSNTAMKAKAEFDLLEQTTPDAIVLEFKDEILALVEKFGNSGQSGGSAPFTASVISQVVQKLCLQEQLGELTGDHSEWDDILEYDLEAFAITPTEETEAIVMDINKALANQNSSKQKESWQSKRNAAVFKDEHGAYYLDAVIWVGEEKYDTFTGFVEDISSAWTIKGFPFTPKKFYINVHRVPTGDNDYEYKITDRSQLDEVYAYYKEPRNTKQNETNKESN